MNLKAIVLDLDDTLLDTTGLLIPIARTPAFHERIRQPLPLMEGALQNLEYLKKKYDLYLLTQGHFESQAAKVASLKIALYFKDIFYVDLSKGETKAIYFEKISKIYGTAFMSIGNRRSTDLREAKRRGGMTCLFDYGEHKHEGPVEPEDNPDFTVNHHQELLTVCPL